MTKTISEASARIKRDSSIISSTIISKIPDMIADELNARDREYSYDEVSLIENWVRIYLRQRI